MNGNAFLSVLGIKIAGPHQELFVAILAFDWRGNYTEDLGAGKRLNGGSQAVDPAGMDDRVL
jgi:hypothetical protein